MAAMAPIDIQFIVVSFKAIPPNGSLPHSLAKEETSAMIKPEAMHPTNTLVPGDSSLNTSNNISSSSSLN